MLLESDASNWYAIDVAVVAGVISVFAAMFTGLQWWEARKTRRANERAIQTQADALKEQAEVGRMNADAAKRSADAAEESARSTKLLSESSQRAWMNIEHIEPKFRDDGLPNLLTIFLINTGPTPAKRLTVLSGWAAYDEFPANLFESEARMPPEMSRAVTEGAGVLGPRVVFIAKVRIFPTQEEQKRIRERSTVLYAYCSADYEDIFGSNHQEKWAFSYSVSETDFRPIGKLYSSR